MTTPITLQIPSCTWNRPIGLGWDKPYTVRYPSNIDDGPWHGMPLGGFGAGCIGRSSRGDFNLWHIDGGEHIFNTFPACQFSIFESTGISTKAYALSSQPPEDGTLQTWQWYPASSTTEETGKYHALYPRSWFVYENVFQTDLTCEQFSPIWANNYQETSYPVAVFVWKAHNPTNAPITLSIMLTWENMVGWFTNALKSPQVQIRDDGSPVYEYQPRLGASQGNYNQIVENTDHFSCFLGRVASGEPVGEGDGSWSIATPKHPQVEIFYHTRWDSVGTGADIWQSFATDGSLANNQDATPADENTRLGAAIAIRFTLQPGETLEIPFTLAWDFPVTEFSAGINYYRRYTDFFGRNGENAGKIATTGLLEYQNWRSHILTWQNPILDREDLPKWFKMALFNELYDLTSGGTLWSAASEIDPIGQFAVLECLDYRWYESLDVRLYGSFALLMLFPELEKSVIRAFARAIPHSDDYLRVIGYYYTIGADTTTAVRKVAGATPHDLGAPNEHVWEKTNYTCYQDCNLWKDLGSDFVLQVYRDFIFTGGQDVEFLADCWDAIVQTLDYLKTFDLDGDGIPENSGAPDQTFDDWRLQGVSAYCGGLWLAALESAIAICDILTNRRGAENAEKIRSQKSVYQSWLQQSLPIYQEKLWNGQYYRLDSESGSNVVMADQLCGQFYARLLGLPDIVPNDNALSALQTVYDACFVKFCNGQFGAANGVRPDGSPENPQATHPLEVWTGINFGLAAFLIQMGMKNEAMRLTQAVVQQIYDNGLQFRTPEAITSAGTFRASTYLRAMAIWAIYLKS
ncbi:bile acid beta-glucosidase [Anabaena cylindrica FACHB-243]|uniref:Glucosylceramidase n=1 Tax=Anabaena cylindrica (strain ATCC 27899 / PCC 7122) TaxID=272123 RepID=K9ZDR0_ANACC|nr:MULTISPECIES: GH116 family glycosyl hydrolase [Anabaena]AFZ56515.1 Glucosylceramidase [Anabaena cylindrica PCC 7122]MBD2418551.1 bile acid beta-glucosidase [Anabaena cylindrica FACHB-243]MBY5284178.1 bile acid beta-glucosidase [Anabaena sp. CCAP 1446/1C]MBY5310873.1 bile acid beta-glucosidase [Anabaena sp. CCAP 1446/1C]MCM2409935.1 GH116 family glycosyl hydrolase [Anabaena sp. CCAP 1446/1C]